MDRNAHSGGQQRTNCSPTDNETNDKKRNNKQTTTESRREKGKGEGSNRVQISKLMSVAPPSVSLEFLSAPAEYLLDDSDDEYEDHSNSIDDEEDQLNKKLDEELLSLRALRDDELTGGVGVDGGDDSDSHSDGEEFQSLLAYRPRCAFRNKSPGRKKQEIVSPVVTAGVPFHTAGDASIAAINSAAEAIRLDLAQLEFTIDGATVPLIDADHNNDSLSSSRSRPNSSRPRPSTGSKSRSQRAAAEEKTPTPGVAPTDDGTDAFISNVAHEVDELRSLIALAPGPSPAQINLINEGVSDIQEWARAKRTQLVKETADTQAKIEEEEKKRGKERTEPATNSALDRPSLPSPPPAPHQTVSPPPILPPLLPSPSPSPRASASSSNGSSVSIVPSSASVSSSAVASSLARSLAREATFKAHLDEERQLEMKRNTAFIDKQQEAKDQQIKERLYRQAAQLQRSKKEEARLQRLEEQKRSAAAEAARREAEAARIRATLRERSAMRVEDQHSLRVAADHRARLLSEKHAQQVRDHLRERTAMREEDSRASHLFRVKQEAARRERQLRDEKDAAERAERERLESIRIEAARIKAIEEKRQADEYAEKKRAEQKRIAEEEEKRKAYEAEVLRAKEELLRQKIESERLAAELRARQLEEARLRAEEEERQRQEAIERELARREQEERERREYFERQRLEKEAQAKRELERIAEERRIAEAAEAERRAEEHRRAKEAERERIKAEKLLKRHTAAARVLQKVWRGRQVRRSAAARQWRSHRAAWSQKRFAAAQRIQSLARGHLLRSKLRRIRLHAKGDLDDLGVDDDFDYGGLDPTFYHIPELPEFDMELPEEAKRMLNNAAQAGRQQSAYGHGVTASLAQSHSVDRFPSASLPSSSPSPHSDPSLLRLHSAGVASKLSSSGRGGLIASSLQATGESHTTAAGNTRGAANTANTTATLAERDRRVNNFFNGPTASQSHPYGHALVESTKFPRIGTPTSSSSPSPPSSAGGFGAPIQRISTAVSDAGSDASHRSADYSSRPEGPSPVSSAPVASRSKSHALAELSAAWGVTDPRTLEAMLRKKQKMSKMRGAKKVANMTADDRLEKFQRAVGGGAPGAGAGNKKKKQVGPPAAWLNPPSTNHADDADDGDDVAYDRPAYAAPSSARSELSSSRSSVAAAQPPVIAAGLNAPSWLTQPSKPNSNVNRAKR